LPFVLLLAVLTGAEKHAFQLPRSERACASDCAHSNCSSPSIRYGRFCGAVHTGCEGDTPCDEYDGCCAAHDTCVATSSRGAADQECHRDFGECLQRVAGDSSPTFLALQEYSAHDRSACSAQTVVDTLLDDMRTASLFSHTSEFGLPMHASDASTDGLPRGVYVDPDGTQRYSAERDFRAHRQAVSGGAMTSGADDGQQPAARVWQDGDGPPVYFREKARGGFTVGLHAGHASGGEAYSAERDADAQAERMRQEVAQEVAKRRQQRMRLRDEL
jgi:hypothetical protein